LSEPLQITPAVARGRFRPELWTDSQWTAEEKLDGVRYLWHHHGDHFHLTSRRISVRTSKYVEKADNFPQLGDLLNLFPAGTVLDGELVTSDRKSYSTITLSGSKPDRAVGLQQAYGWAKYIIFDVPSYYSDEGYPRAPLVQRKDYLYSAFLHCDSPHLELVRNQYISRETFMEDILAQGGEGVILKDLNSFYGDPTAWVKVKPIETYDVVILDYQPANVISTKVDGSLSPTKFHEKGWIGAVVMGKYIGNCFVSIGTCSGFDDETRQYLSENQDECLGRVIEVKAQERLPSGALRHPRFVRFRDDKNPEDCTMAQDEMK